MCLLRIREPSEQFYVTPYVEVSCYIEEDLYPVIPCGSQCKVTHIVKSKHLSR
jgi:hypothetical protein